MSLYTSIIIPTYNRCDVLRRALDSIFDLDHPADDHEVIVVDNGSTDQTRRVVEEAAARHSMRAIRYIYEPVPGLLSGRHRGALEAKGNICAYLDDDVRLDRNWLNGLEEAFRDPQVAIAGGPSRPLFESEAPAWLANFYTEDGEGRSCGWLSLFDGGKRVKEINPRYVWGLNFAVRRKVLFELGGFHPDCIPKSLQRFQGDGETGLSLQVSRAGLKALYHPQASLQHEIPGSRLTVKYFEQRAFYQGVADSYTQIRADGRLCQPPQRWKDPLRSIKQFLLDMLPADATTPAAIRRRTGRAYRAGMAFHQDEVDRDPALLEWIVRKDYWSYELPAGWQMYEKGSRG